MQLNFVKNRSEVYVVSVRGMHLVMYLILKLLTEIFVAPPGKAALADEFTVFNEFEMNKSINE